MSSVQSFSLQRFKQNNISKFLKEYESHMVVLGRGGEAANLCRGLICFVEDEVQEALEGNEAFRDNNWEGVKNFLRNRYRRYDGLVTRRTVEAELRKREYVDLHGYLRSFEFLVGKLQGTEVLTPGEKVAFFVRGLKAEDSQFLMPKLMDNATRDLTQNWEVVVEAIEAYVAQRDVIERYGGLMNPKTEHKKEETIRGKQTVTGGVKDDRFEELTRQFAELKIQHLQLQKNFDKEKKPQRSVTTLTTETETTERVKRCLYCDDTEHDKRDCPLLTLHLNEHKVKLNERRRVCNVDSGQEYRMNIGRGGIKELVIADEKKRNHRVENEKVTIGESYALTLEGGCGADRVTKPKLATKDELRAAADQVRGLTGWDCPVDATSLRAYFDVDVEGKRARDEGDVGERRSLRRVRADPGEGSSSTPPSQQRTGTTGEEMDVDRKIAQARNRRSQTGMESPDPVVTQPSGPNSDEAQPTRSEKGKEPARSTTSSERANRREETTVRGSSDKESSREQVRYQRRSEVEMAVDPEEFVMRAILDAQTTIPVKDMLAVVNPTILRMFRSKITKRNVPVTAVEGIVGEEEFDIGSVSVRRNSETDEEDYLRDYYARGSLTAPVRIGKHILTALLDAGSEVNLMPRTTYEDLGLRMDDSISWRIRNADNRPSSLLGVCHHLPIEIGGIVEEFHVFVTEKCGYDLILGRPWEAAMRAAYRNLDDGTCWLKVYSRDGRQAVQLMVMPTDHPHNREKIHEADF
jgi:hypothetical protein